MEAQEAPQRLKIADRLHLARRWKQGAADLAQTANRLADLYRGLQIGEFTADALADVYATGGAEARRRYIEAAKEDAAKVRSHAIRTQIEQEAEQWRTPFAEAARQAKESAERSGGDARQLLDFLTLDSDGRFTVSEDAARLIDEATAVYLTDPEEIEKYRQHLAAVDALNAFFEDGATAPVLWYSVFEMGEDGRVKIPSAGVNYAYLLAQRKRKEGAEAAAPEPRPMAEPETAEPRPELTQHNRAKSTAPRMVKGISKDPDQRNRGEELRAGKHHASPDAPD